jgi:hypothetical protein
MTKNITLSAENTLLSLAREKALKERTTLNVIFRTWLKQYVRPADRAADYSALMSRLRYARPGRRFSRDEMNER